jgi:hypothetical protein
MRIRRRWKVVAVVFAVCSAGAIAAQTVIGGSDRVKIGAGSVSALARAARPADRLPASVLALPFADSNFASPTGDGSRLLRTDGSLSLYAVPGKGRLVCLIEVDSLAQTAGGSCADRRVLLTGSIFMADVREDGRKDIVGLVGDGHTFADADGRRVVVTANAFILRGVASNTVTIGSPTATQVVEITD